ncbi:MAG: hypothetical protein CVV64_18525 [Candidatus Wallbacteria bacterium HGW-Wallbacteria-1]|jgi:hypothetical protein|uniref:Gingipain domain-containing protein n=1 Tax=Candidatus Wallbacteria bacterium HGW-Wallbacteria-1 TaxID=2013854 RepID=A0A2N1PJJ2_9BACT|nr:MAG: hypothetical protein CVV64_18525 [Candidatus Wallbacteria bacterium HGW-Wallbacteria-1]
MPRNLFILMLAMVMATAPALAGVWVPVDEQARSPRVPSVQVMKSDAASTILEVRVHGYVQDDVTTQDGNLLSVSIPGVSMIMEKGSPEVPKLTAFIQIPNDSDVAVKILDSEYRDVRLESDIAPSKGHILRNMNPSEVPYTYGDTYADGTWFPTRENLVTVSEPFILRDVRGVRVAVAPFSYNASEKTLRVVTRMRVLLANVVGRTNIKKSVRRSNSGSADFNRIYGNLFLNFSSDASYTQKEEAGGLVILAHDSFMDAVKPLATWKKKAGYKTELVKLSDVGSTTDDIKAFIADRYKNGAVFFILVGDSPQIPTLKGKYERAASDPAYTKIEGDDNVPDAFISRLSGLTAADIENQVARIIAYESKPMTGADAEWYGKALGIASGEGSPTDYERCDELHDSLKNYTYTSAQELYDRSYSNRPRPADVIAAVNDGRSLINYIGHGSENSWVTSSFSTRDMDKLENGLKLPVIWSVACVNGKFEGTYDCFCEKWMKVGTKENPKGAACIFGASTNAAWVPPCDMQGEIIHNLLCKEQKLTAGGQAVNGVLKGMEIWGTDDKTEGNMLMEQFNLFGDCSMMVRTRKPGKVNVDMNKSKDGVSFTITSDGKSVSSARVAVYSSDMATWESAVTDDTGRADIKTTGEGLLYTVTGFNLVPVIDAPLK